LHYDGSRCRAGLPRSSIKQLDAGAADSPICPAIQHAGGAVVKSFKKAAGSRREGAFQELAAAAR